MADRKNKLGLSVAIGASAECRIASLVVVAEPRLRGWYRDRNYFDANDAILIPSQYFGSLNVLFVSMLRLASHK
jgi:hypothetical protein